MKERKPVAEMSGAELSELLDSLTPEDALRMLAHLAGAAPEAFDRALNRVMPAAGGAS